VNDPKDTEYEVLETRTETVPATESPFDGVGMLTPAALQQAEFCVEGVKRVKALALRITNESDWRRMGNKAYLQKSGCMKVARLFGVSFKDMTVSREERKKESGEFVTTFTAKVTAEFRGAIVREIGTADSDKQFYSAGGEDEDTHEKLKKSYDDRDFSSMKKHAVTNAMNRALKSCLGLDGVLWSDVEGAIGKEAAARVGAHSYQGKGKPAETVADQDVKAKLRQMLLDMASGDEAEAAALLRKYTTFKGKDGSDVSVGSVNEPKFSAKWMAATYGKVKKDWEAAGLNGPPAGEPTAQTEPGDEG
jgi:hypothetical protein